jgi:signal transduction histidine kinase
MSRFEKSGGVLTSLPDPEILKFERADWTAFRTIEGLQQKAGVSAGTLRRLVLKELVDNALDAGGNVTATRIDDGRYCVEDDGPGIPGEQEDIARLFCISRPLLSTKLLRLPTRGALGNGLRVVAGAVLASDGSLVVTSRNRRIELRPERDGTTTVVSSTPLEHPTGTRIEIGFGPAIPDDPYALSWARLAIRMQGGQTYAGRSSGPPSILYLCTVTKRTLVL